MHMNSAFTPAQIFIWHQCPSPQLQLSFHSFLLFCCLSSKNNEPWLLFTNIVQTWLSYPSTWPTVRLLEKHGFLPANQQRSGCATDSDIFASDQSIMAWSISNFSVFTEFGKFEFFAPNLLPHLWSSHENYQWHADENHALHSLNVILWVSHTCVISKKQTTYYKHRTAASGMLDVSWLFYLFYELTYLFTIYLSLYIVFCSSILHCCCFPSNLAGYWLKNAPFFFCSCLLCSFMEDSPSSTIW